MLTPGSGDGQVDKLLRVVGHDKTVVALYGPEPSPRLLNSPANDVAWCIERVA